MPPPCCRAEAIFISRPILFSSASSIGGNASTNAGGIHVLKDFASSNHVLGFEMVPARWVGAECRRRRRYETGVRSAGLDLRT